MKQLSRFTEFLQVLLIAMAAACTVRAESNTIFIVDTGTTNTDAYGLGVNGTNNVLIVTNGGHLATAGTAYIGSNSISLYNRAYVSGNGSLWSSTASINVGYLGGQNSLYISQTGKAQSAVSTAVGQYSSDNTLTVSDGGLLTNALVLSIGVNGRRNTVTVTNGGIVCAGTYISLGANSAMNGNQLIVTGTGSVCKAGTDFTCGSSSATNYVTVSNGGAILVGSSSSGLTTVGNHLETHRNRLLVTGSGSLYSNLASIIVGKEGSNNYLTVGDGGRVWSASTLIGQSGVCNVATVSGAGSILSNSISLYVGSNGYGNQLVVSNGGYVICTNIGFAGYDSASSNNVISVSGAGSVFSNSAWFYIGYNGGSNTASVSDGGKMGIYMLYVGAITGADNNLISLSGANSLMKCTQVYFGDQTRGNRLTVGDGALLDSTFIFLGNSFGADSNIITASGNGSVITGFYFYAGMDGANNSFQATNGAAIYCQEAQLGYHDGSDRNSLTIDGSNSTMNCGSKITIGQGGQFCNLYLQNNGKLISGSGTIGNGESASGNEVVVSGYGVWSNLNTLCVGNTGALNRLTITNRGTFYSGALCVGQDPASSNNLVSIHGSTCNITGVCDIIRGTNILDAGLMQVGTLLITNSSGKIDFRRGLLRTENVRIANGSAFYVGNGTAAATNLLVNNGTHYYADGMIINPSGALAGNGTIIAPVLMDNGAYISPGESIGLLAISNLTIAGGTYVYEKNSSSADLINVSGPLSFISTPQLTILLKDAGGANFVGTNTLINYGSLSGSCTFDIDYGTTGMTGYTVTNNASAKRIELISPHAPAAPEPLAASGITTNSFIANWSASVNATNYFLDAATDSAFTSFVSGYNNHSAGNVAAVTISGLSPNSAYYYRIRAQGLGGTSANSATIAVTTHPLPPTQPPTGVNATRGAFTDRVRIAWNSVSNASTYEVWRNIADDSSGASHLAGDPSATVYDDTTVTVGTTYYYWVKAKNAGGTSAFSSSASGYASPSVPAPSTPTGVSATKGTYGSKVVVSWNTVSNAASYEVWRNTINDSSSAVKFGTEPSLATYEDTSVTARTVYYYWVKAKNSAGTSSFSASDSGFASPSGDTRWLPACGDLDGDAKTDPTVYQPLTGTWKTKLSTANYTIFTTAAGFLGGTNYICLAADFDGDAKADPTACGNVNTLWMTRLSSLGYAVGAIISFGNSNYTAVAADFDGDGLADPALYQAANGNWTVKLSTAGYAEIPLPSLLGADGWAAFGADFDGDRLADPAVYESATGAWSVKLSGAGYAQIDLPAGWMGGTGWLAAIGDYDGDGLADPCVYEPATANWKVKLSSAGYAEISLTNFLGGMQ